MIFATWFTYDAQRQAAVAVDDREARPRTQTFTGTLLTQTGPPFNAVPFTPSQVRERTASARVP